MALFDQSDVVLRLANRIAELAQEVAAVHEKQVAALRDSLGQQQQQTPGHESPAAAAKQRSGPATGQQADVQPSTVVKHAGDVIPVESTVDLDELDTDLRKKEAAGPKEMAEIEEQEEQKEEWGKPGETRAQASRGQASVATASAQMQRLSTTSAKRRLHVEVVRATGLRDADWLIGTGSSDPYCIVRVAGRDTEAFCTPTINDTVNPHWNYAGVVLDFTEEDSLQFEIYDKDIGKSDDYLGTASLHGWQIFPKGFEGMLTVNAGLAGRGSTVAGLADEHGGELRVNIHLDEDDNRFFEELRETSRARWLEAASRESESGGGGGGSVVFLTAEDARAAETLAHRFSAVQAERAEQGWMQRFVVPPSVEKSIFWNAFLLVALSYDAFVIPFMHVFGVDMDLWFAVVGFFFTVAWTVDFVGAFFVGYTTPIGAVEMRIKLIAMNYAKGWLLPDLAIVLIDWVLIFAWLAARTSGTQGAEFVRTIKAARVLRALRLLRLGKATSLLETVLTALSQELRDLVARLIESFWIVLYATHFVCCAWYALGTSDNYEATWVTVRNLQDRDLLYRYTTSFHWAITQYTPASMEVQPVNSIERLFAVIVDLCGLIAFSTFISNITTIMTQLRSFKKARDKQDAALKKYLHENKISLELMSRIMAYASSHSKAVKTRTNAESIDVIKDLPEPLKKELAAEAFLPTFTRHPFLLLVSEVDLQCASRICCLAVSEHALVKNATLFSKGDAAKGMYFVLSGGTISYHRIGAVVALRMGEWISEAAVWMPGWLHRGDAIATRRTDMVGINGSAFRKIIDELFAAGELTAKMMHRYAASFLGHECEETTDEVLRRSDIWGNREEIANLTRPLVERRRSQTTAAWTFKLALGF